MSALKNPVLIARLGGAHGIRGEIRAQAFTDDPLDVGEYGPLQDRSGRVFEVLSAKPAKTVVILRLKGVSDRSAAEALNGLELFVDRDRLPDDGLDEDEFYQTDLIGLAVVDAENIDYGEVIAVHDFGGGDILEIQRPGERSVMIPFSAAAVTEVDFEAAKITVDAVAAGLIDDPEELRTAREATQEAGGPTRAPGRSGTRRRRPPSSQS
jgi:16S rRNA processing protein RimM